jgi:DNA-binding NarL/FixJ family response regulator
MPKRVLVVEDHALVAISLQVALSAGGWIIEITSGPTAADVIEHARRFGPRSVLLDIRLGMSVGCGIDLIAPLRQTGAEVVMLTAETDPAVLASCLEAGAAGWIGKDASLEAVESALGDVSDGVPLVGSTIREAMLEKLRSHRAAERSAISPFEQLSMREREVLSALVDGLSAEEIAETRFVSLTTVRSQIRSILRKLGVRSQLAAVARANRVGWASCAEQLAIA